jgi:hypothetical protein
MMMGAAAVAVAKEDEAPARRNKGPRPSPRGKQQQVPEKQQVQAKPQRRCHRGFSKDQGRAAETINNSGSCCSRQLPAAADDDGFGLTLKDSNDLFWRIRDSQTIVKNTGLTGDHLFSVFSFSQNK